MSCSSATGQQEAKEETLMPAKTIDSHTCARCKERRGVLVVVHTSYCSDCLTHLLRIRFSKSVIPHLPALNQNVQAASKASFLLASSGGSASAAMIDFFRLAFCPPTDDAGPKGRHRWNRIVVGWVDFGEEADDRRYERETAMRRSAEAHGFEFWRVPVEEAFDEQGALMDPPGAEHEPERPTVGSIGIRALPGRVLHTSFARSCTRADSPYRALMAHLPPTSHPAMRAHILHSLLTRMALSLDQSPTPAATSAPATPLPFLLLGTTSTRIASLTIASLAVGRGYALPLLVTPFLEYRGVRMLRPLTASGKKELVWYARWRGLAAVDWDWESGARNSDSGRATSIEALTQDFVQTLNSTHPSTVSTIARTSHKLLFPGFLGPDRKPLGENAKRTLWTEGHICPLCELPSDEAPLDWLARTSITTGRGPDAPVAAAPEADERLVQESPTASIPIERQLCYACLTTLVSPSAVNGARAVPEGLGASQHVILPAWTLPNLVRETVKSRQVPGDDASPSQPRREEVGHWLKEEGWLLEEDDA